MGSKLKYMKKAVHFSPPYWRPSGSVVKWKTGRAVRVDEKLDGAKRSGTKSKFVDETWQNLERSKGFEGIRETLKICFKYVLKSVKFITSGRCLRHISSPEERGSVRPEWSRHCTKSASTKSTTQFRNVWNKNGGDVGAAGVKNAGSKCFHDGRQQLTSSYLFWTLRPSPIPAEIAIFQSIVWNLFRDAMRATRVNGLTSPGTLWVDLK